MPSAPSFSVVIAARDAEETISRALRSVLAQTLPAHQIIVCDDGSTDATEEVARSHDGVTCISQPARGLSAARNTAAARATGSHVVLLDADDEWQPERLAAMAALLDDRPDVDVVTTDAEVREVDGGRRRYYAGIAFPEPDAQPVEILRRNFVFTSSAVRRSRFEEVGG
ncbi:MAG: hypothetical protein QOE63_1288, partial [Acidimicrobiaceae bacterium]